MRFGGRNLPIWPFWLMVSAHKGWPSPADAPIGTRGFGARFRCRTRGTKTMMTDRERGRLLEAGAVIVSLAMIALAAYAIFFP